MKNDEFWDTGWPEVANTLIIMTFFFFIFYFDLI
jgi:hypothetical protein